MLSAPESQQTFRKIWPGNGKNTSLMNNNFDRRTLFARLHRNGIRKNAQQRMIASGSIERIVSSKSRVKSKPPRQSGPAQGPNMLSAKKQLFAEFDAMIVR